MIKKNDVITSEVADLTVGGDGICKPDGYPVFVAGAIVGDLVQFEVTKTNKTYGFGKLTKIIKPSPDRRTPPCPSFCDCGGCTLMHMSYEGQTKYKSDFVLSNLCRIGGYKKEDFVYEEIIGAKDEFFYRNKAQFPVGMSKGKAVCGFYLAKSHIISPCENCMIQDKRINRAVALVMDYIRDEKLSVYSEKTHKGTIRHIYVRCSRDELMVVIVTNSREKLKNTSRLTEELNKIAASTLLQNINTRRTNVILGGENIVLSGSGFIHMELDDLRFKVSPHSFFQVNTAQMKKLYAKAVEYADLKGDETVFDLYSGVGSISLCMAKKAKEVIGVEIVGDAVENAIENADINNIQNARFYCGDCTEVVHRLIDEGKRADVAIVDPPRKGCDDKLLSLLKDMSPQKIVYVSCNSATLARDIALLREHGYVLQKACAVDLFPQTGHVECCVLLCRK